MHTPNSAALLIETAGGRSTTLNFQLPQPRGSQSMQFSTLRSSDGFLHGD